MSSLKILFVFLCLILCFKSLALAQEEKQFLITIKLNETILILSEQDIQQIKEIKRYKIAVPAKTDPYPLPLVGEVKIIVLDPFWYPTNATRSAYFKKKRIILPKIIPPGHRLNAMGKVKFIVEFVNFFEPIRLHGTNDPSSIGKRISRGCIRMRDEDALEIAQIISKGKAKIIIEN